MEENNNNETVSINPIKKEESIVENKVEEVKPVTPVPEPMPNPEGKKKGSGAVAILTVVIILLVVGLIYMLVFYKDKDDGKDNNDNSKPTPTPSVTPSAIPSATPTPEPTKDVGSNELVVYRSEWGQFIGSYTEDTEKIVVKVQSKNATFLASDFELEGKFFLYDDDGLKIYDYKNKKSIDVELSNKYKEYDLFLNDNKDKAIGISFVDDNSMSGYYNINTKKEMYKNKYKYSDEEGFIRVINNERLTVFSNGVGYLLDSNNEKVLASYKPATEEPNYRYGSYGKNGSYIYSLEYCYDDCVYRKILSTNLDVIYDKELNEGDFDVYNNALYLNAKNYAKKYSVDGKELLVSENYEQIDKIVNNYVIYEKGNKLVLENIDNKSESVVLNNDTKGIYFESFTSGYYSREDLDRLEEKNKKEGLYVVVYNGDGSKKDSKGYYGMEYCYTPDKQVVEYPIKEAMGGRAKPVLYLYPEEETSVNVKFAHPEYLTTTYPKYNGSWKVTAKPNGDLTDKDGKYYYALYWDEVRYSETDFSEGFYVESKDAIKFLEEKLTIIGLNAKERNEFIMYWLPIMENNKKNLVYFELTDEREANNKLIITPKPDSLLRVSIHIKKVNEKVDIKEQKLPTFNRTGFTAIEWGGMTY